MPHVIVIGYGNRLRGDDGFGPLAAEQIAGHDLPDLTIVVVHQLGPELAPELSEADIAVFLDAKAANVTGLIEVAPVVPKDLSGATMSHSLEPGSLLALTRAIYGRTPTATLVTASASRFEHGDTIGAEIRAAAERTATAVVRLVREGRLDREALRSALAGPSESYPVGI